MSTSDQHDDLVTGPGKERKVESPCVRICKQDRQAGFCIGCGRTVQEVFRWYDMPDSKRRETLAELPGRLESVKLNTGE
ncbi:hypothetical protein A8B82_15950 [Sulfitobacter sp. EhC04]|nr:hypothetical protein A8B82_15950 [Sulfitobacter sp. EhC04]